MFWAIDHPDQADGLDRLSAILKIFSSNTVREVTADAMEIFGSWGYVRGYQVEKLVRDAFAMRIRGIPNDVLTRFLAEEL